MKKYRFYLYRDVFLPGPDTAPEIRDIETDNPEKTATELCRGSVHRVDWEPYDL